MRKMMMIVTAVFSLAACGVDSPETETARAYPEDYEHPESHECETNEDCESLACDIVSQRCVDTEDQVKSVPDWTDSDMMDGIMDPLRPPKSVPDWTADQHVEEILKKPTCVIIDCSIWGCDLGRQMYCPYPF